MRTEDLSPGEVPIGSLRYLRRPEVLRLLGVTTPTLYRWLREGIFPRPTQIGLRTVGWPEPVVRDWIAEREASRAAA